MARFGLTFEETEAAPAFPSSTLAAADKASASSDAAAVALADDFEAGYSVEGQPAITLDSLAAVVSSAAAAMDAAFAPLMADAQHLAALRRDLGNLVSSVYGLLRQPADLVTGLANVLTSLTSTEVTARQGITALLAAYGFTPAIVRPPATTATRVQELANYDALVRLVRILIVVQAARLATSATFDTYDDAIAVRDALGDALDEQMGGAGDDAFKALEQLRADLVRAVPGDASDLPHLMSYSPAYTVPSLVLAQRLYGSLDREADLVTRNGVSHPGFVAGGLDLEVLSDA